MALLFSPVGLLLISSARLIIISDFNTTTATTVASSGGYVNTLLGSLIPLVPIFIPYVALILLLFRRFVLSIVAFVFTVFITPTSLRPPVTAGLATLDEHLLLTWVSGDWFITLIIALLIGLAAWAVTGSFAEALSILVAVALLVLLLLSIKSPSLPAVLDFAGTTEQQIALIIVNERTLVAIGLASILGLAIYITFKAFDADYFLTTARMLTTFVAVATTFALFPYVANLYPVPQQSSYYVAIIRAPWLPAEMIRISSGLVYNGYVLSTDNNWFVVLLAHERRIVYLPANDVTGRTVCQLRAPRQPRPRKPLFPLFYANPPRIPPCPRRVDVYASRTSFLSRGQSLNVISFIVHVPPEKIISVTNAYQHHKLSTALRAYESSGDWNAPTPVGQHFWYYPPV